jgi:hypothetical protein
MMKDKARIVPDSKYRSASLEALAAEWQKILRLQDWDISIYEVPSCELEESQMAWCSTHIPSRAAMIFVLEERERINRQQRHEGTGYFPHDTIEAIIVHELLHLYTQQTGITKEKYKDDDKEYLAMEQMVSSLSHAFVNMKYDVRMHKQPTMLMVEPDIEEAAKKVVASWQKGT